MVYHRTPALDATFAALADGTRRAMLARLAEGEATVSELAEPHAMSLPAVSKHLRVLERAGLVVRRKQGRVRRCTLVALPLGDAARWIARYRRFWEHQFDRLERYLEQETHEETHPWPHSSTPPSPSDSPAPSRRRGNGSSGRGRRRKN